MSHYRFKNTVTGMESHRALQNDDVLRVVFGNLSADTDGHEVAGLARVCKAFSEPALDLLWRVLPCVMPLLKLLPIEVHDEAVSFLNGAVTDHEWSRFRHYAHRVRKLLAICPSHRHIFDPSLSSELLRRASEQPLLPSLLQLACPYPLVSAFTSGSLLALAVFAIAPQITWDTLVSAVAVDAPYLQCLILNGRASPEPSGLPSLEQLKDLRILRLNEPVSAECVTVLAKLPNLNDLSISLNHSEIHDASAPCARFVALQKLTLRDGSISNVMHVMKEGITSPHLEALTIGDTFRPFLLPPQTWPSFWHHLGDVLVPDCLQSLREVSIKTKVDTGLEAHPNIASLTELIQPLFRLSLLEDVALLLSGLSLHFADADVRDMATAWPHLRELDLAQDAALTRSTVSVRVLAEFAVHCPTLRVLKFSSLDLAALAPADLNTLSPPRAHALRVLDLYADWRALGAVEKMRCARFLDRMFPALRECVCEGDGALPRVCDLLEAFQAVRAEQIMRADALAQ